MPISFDRVLGETFWAVFFLEPHFESGAGCWAGLGWVEGLGEDLSGVAPGLPPPARDTPGGTVGQEAELATALPG